MLNGCIQDIRYGVRSLLRAKGLAITALLTLALGIGANTAIFTVVNSVLLRPLPYKDSGNLVALFIKESHQAEDRNPTSPAEFLDWKKQCSSLQTMTAARPWAPSLTGLDRPDQIAGLKVSASLFDLLGVAPAFGRTFRPEEGEPGNDTVAVLGYGLWQRRFGGDPAVVGKTLQLDAKPYKVIGVMPQGFSFPPFWFVDAEFWSPLSFTSQEAASRDRMLRVFARLSPGSTLAQARTEMQSIAETIRAGRPEAAGDLGVSVEPLLEPVVSRARTPLLLLLVAVGFVLLIACANVTNLLLARATARRREIGVRIALGASRARLVRQFLTESLLLAITGGALGMGAALLSLSALNAVGAENLPRMAEIHADSRVLFFTAVVSVGAVLLFGLLPAWTAARSAVNNALKEGGRQSTGSAPWLRNALVVTEVALALVLLAGAGLALRSFWKINGIDPGFRRENVLTATVVLAGSPYAGKEAQPIFQDQLLARLRNAPGIERAGFISFLHMGGDLWTFLITLADKPAPPPEQNPLASFKMVSPGYFGAAGTTLLQGRDFSAQDTGKSQPVAIINQALAEKHWPGQNPLGKQIKFGMPDSERPWMTVVGVVADVRQEELTRTVAPEIYIPYTQTIVPWFTFTTLVVRTKGEAAGLTRTVQENVWALSPNLPVTQIRTLDQIFSRATSQPRTGSALIATFAGLALLLSLIGIYGVLNYAVTQRSREIGIRAALGAQPRQVLALVMGSGLKLTLTGVAIGLLGALALTRLLQGMLYGIEPTDPLTFAAVTGLLTTVGLAASYLPARRAMRVDPLVALRYE